MQSDAGARDAVASSAPVAARHHSRALARFRIGVKRASLLTWGAVAVIAASLATVSWIVFRALEDDSSAGPERAVSLGDVEARPSVFYGDSVTVSGRIEDVLAPFAFALGSREALAPESVLVVGQGVATGREEDDLVRVTGVVQPVGVVKLREELRRELDPEVFLDWIGQPAIVAEDVERVDGGHKPAEGARGRDRA